MNTSDRDNLVLAHLQAGGVRAIGLAAGLHRRAVENALAVLEASGRIVVSRDKKGRILGRIAVTATSDGVTGQTVTVGDASGDGVTVRGVGGSTNDGTNDVNDVNETSLKSLEIKDSSRLVVPESFSVVTPGDASPVTVTLLVTLARLGYSVVPTALLERLTAGAASVPVEASPATTVQPLDAEAVVTESPPPVVEPEAPRSSSNAWKATSGETKWIKGLVVKLLKRYPKPDGTTGEDDVHRYQFERVQRSMHNALLHVLLRKPVTKTLAAVFWDALVTTGYGYHEGSVSCSKEFVLFLQKSDLLSKARAITWAEYFFGEGLELLDVDLGERPEVSEEQAARNRATLATITANVGRTYGARR